MSKLALALCSLVAVPAAADERLGPAVPSGGPAPPLTPTIAAEVSGAVGDLVSPWVAYRGWTLENGPPTGVRAELELGGMQAAYELTSMSNDRACGASGCVTGAFGRTTLHTFELGYRLRIGRLGPVRPFVTTTLGAVVANAGTWAMSTDRTIYGGAARAGLGVEYPFAAHWFASATVAYRFMLTENPLREDNRQIADKALIGGKEQVGDFVEDAHLVALYVGIGVGI